MVTHSRRGGASNASEYDLIPCVETALNDMPEDMEALRAAFLAMRSEASALKIENARLAAENVFLDTLNQKLAHYVAKLKRLTFGPSSEKLDPEQLQLALEDLEQKIAEVQAEAEKTAPEEVKTRRARDRRNGRPSLPDTLAEVNVTIEPDLSGCPCCQGPLHRIGEDVSRRLDIIPVQYRRLITHRPKYACRSCEGTILQAPAPERLISGGLPTEAMVVSVVVAKYADHQPLYRQSQGLARQGIEIGRDVLAFWVGYLAAEVKPLWRLMRDQLLAGTVLFVDETKAPVLDPGRGKTKTGYMWTIAQDPRPWRGTDPPAVVFTYAPGRAHAHAVELLKDFNGVVQCDGYGAYKTAARHRNGQVTLSHCWSHVRRDFIDLSSEGLTPIAAEALTRIAKFYAIEAEIRGKPAAERRAVRQAKTKPLVEAMFDWLEDRLKHVPGRLKTAEVIRYVINHRDGLSRFLDDGRLELDTNVVERAIRPITLNRKNALFAGGDEGGETWAILATLIECCKLHSVEPHAYLTDVVTRLVNGHPQSRLAELTPWAWKAAHPQT
jgi:transposase